MANRDAPTGLSPAYHLAGGVIRAQEYKIASGYATAMFKGDLVKVIAGKRLNTGNSALGPFVGVFNGCRFRNARGEYVFSDYWPAGQTTLNSEDAVAFVFDDPNIVYEIQADGNLTSANVGKQADIEYIVGSVTTGVSKTELKSSNIGIGDNLHILELVDRPDNAFGTNAKVHVIINEHAYANAGVANIAEV